MRFNRRDLNVEAKKYHFVANTYEKVVRLTEILNFVQTNFVLHKHLALKGGTAINLTIFDLPRLSVDIDLDFISNMSREQMLETRSVITEILCDYMTKNAYYLDERTRKHHALDSFKFYYTNAAGSKDLIKIEINYMLRCHIYDPITTRNKELGLIPSIEITTLHPYEIFGSKLVALMTRTTPRDLYDFFNYVKLDTVDEETYNQIKKCAIYYRAISNEDGNFDFDLSNLYSITQRDIKRLLNPVIKSSEKFDLNEAIQTITEKFNQYFIPNEEELLFLKNFKNSIYSPELLFDDEKILQKIKNHPMAKWKIKN